MNCVSMAMILERKAQSSQWKLPGSPHLKKVWQSHSKIKTTLTVFFDGEGVIHHEYSPPGQIINKGYFLNVLHQLRDALGWKTATAMGNWWLAASSRQHASSCIMSHEEFFGETSSHPGDSAPIQPRFGALWLPAFPKTKITFEREETSDHPWDSEKYDGAADGDWENCVKS